MKDYWDLISDCEDDMQEMPQKHGEEGFFKCNLWGKRDIVNKTRKSNGQIIAAPDGDKHEQTGKKS